MSDIKTLNGYSLKDTYARNVAEGNATSINWLTDRVIELMNGNTGSGGGSGGGSGVEIPAFESGFITIVNNALNYVAASNRIRTPEGVFINLKAGDIIGLTDYTNHFWAVKYQVDGVWQEKTYYGANQGNWAVPVDGDYAVVIESMDVSSLVDKVDEVAALFFVERDGAIVSGGSNSDSGDDTGTEESEQLTGDTFRFVNLVADATVGGQNGTLSQADGWYKMTPSGASAYPRITFWWSSGLKAGRKYLVAFTLRYSLGDVTANSFSARFVKGGTTLAADSLIQWPTGERYYAPNRCAYIFEPTVAMDTLEMIMGYANASDASGTWYAIKNINVIDITDMENPPEPYHLGNMILAQHDGLIEDTATVDMNKETLFPLQNHTILFLGDSIFGSFNIPKYVSDISKANCINGAVGGSTASWYNASLTLTDSLVNISESIKTGDWTELAESTNASIVRLRELDFHTVNDIVIEIGTNDWRRCADIGTDDSTDIATFKGALNTIISNILSAYPEIDIYLLTPLFRTEFGNSNTTANDSGVYLYDYANAMIDIARKYGIPVYDMYHHGGINEHNHAKYLSDGTHPLPIMRMKMARIINNMIVY